MNDQRTHPVFDAEVVEVTGTATDWRYTLRSITPGVAWQQANLKPRVRVGSNVELTPALPGDLVRVYDRPGDLRIYPYEGIPFDPCDEGLQGRQEPPRGFFASTAAMLAGMFSGGRRGGGFGGASPSPSAASSGSS